MAAGSGPTGVSGHRRAGSWRHGPIEVVVALTALAAILRFATLDLQSIWLDESATILLVHRGLAGMLSHLPSSESAPPLYYVLVWGWTKVFGAGPLGFRSFSALAGTLTVPVLYLAGRNVSPRVGLWAAALAAVNPAMYYYSQETRAYALLILFSAGAFVMWQKALRVPTSRNLAWWSGLSALALLTHYFAVFMFLPEAGVLVWRLGWHRSRISIAAVVVIGAALVPLALRQRTGGQSDWIQTTSLLSRVAQAPKQFLIGLYSPLEIYSALLAGALAAGSLVLLARRGNDHERALARDVALVGIACIAIPLLLAVTRLQDVFNGRNVMAGWTPWALLIAIGLGVARPTRANALLGAGLCVISLFVIIGIDTNPGYQRDNWRGIVKSLKRPATSRILVTRQNGSLPLEVYLPTLRVLGGSTVTTGEVDFVALRSERTGHSPRPPVLPTAPLPGFRLAGVDRTTSYAIARFIAAKGTVVKVKTLRRAIEEPQAEVLLEP